MNLYRVVSRKQDQEGKVTLVLEGEELPNFSAGSVVQVDSVVITPAVTLELN